MDTPWKFRGIPWISMDFHGIPWISIGFHGFPWISMEFHGGISHGLDAVFNQILYNYVRQKMRKSLLIKRFSTKDRGSNETLFFLDVFDASIDFELG